MKDRCSECNELKDGAEIAGDFFCEECGQKYAENVMADYGIDVDRIIVSDKALTMPKFAKLVKMWSPIYMDKIVIDWNKQRIKVVPKDESTTLIIEYVNEAEQEPDQYDWYILEVVNDLVYINYEPVAELSRVEIIYPQT